MLRSTLQSYNTSILPQAQSMVFLTIHMKTLPKSTRAKNPNLLNPTGRSVRASNLKVFIRKEQAKRSWTQLQNQNTSLPMLHVLRRDNLNPQHFPPWLCTNIKHYKWKKPWIIPQPEVDFHLTYNIEFHIDSRLKIFSLIQTIIPHLDSTAVF